MPTLEHILSRVAPPALPIALADGDDPRVIEAALEARRRGIARLTLVGARAAIAGPVGGEIDGIDMAEPATDPRLPALADLLRRTRGGGRLTADAALAQAARPHVFAALLVRAGHAAGTLGGAQLPTAEIAGTALRIIGPDRRAGAISSYFLMNFALPHHPRQGVVIFADCALTVMPGAAKLASIAASSADTWTRLTGAPARVAMLSFSTHGSAADPGLERIREATALVRRNRPDLTVDGELQFDAAFLPEMARAKAPASPLQGAANVFIFPDLNAANIGYKIAQRVGGAQAIGPVLQGLAQPANDLSRGCSAEDILHMIALTALQAGGGPAQ